MNRPVNTCAILGVIAALSLTSACGSDDSSSDSATKGGLIVYSPPISNSPYFQTIGCGVKEAVEKAGYTYDYQAPPKFDGAAHVQVVEAVTARKPAALVVDVTNTAQMKPVLSRLSKQTKIVSSLEPIDIDGQVGSVLFDQKEFGRLQAQALVAKMGESGKVLLVDYQAGSQTLDDRAEGIKDELAKHPDIEIVAHEYGVGDATKAAQITAAVYQRHPDLAGIVSTDIYDMAGVVSQVARLKLKERPALVAADLSPDTQKWVESGEIDALVAQKTFKLGLESGQAAVDALAGKKQEIPTFVEDSTSIVTKANQELMTDPDFAAQSC